MILSFIAAFVLGYLLGSIPFGVLLTNFAGTKDIRDIGSGNIGATNVLRTGRKGLAAATLLGDMLKATAAVLFASALWGRSPALVAGLATFIGHVFPVWLRFKGGKGIATFIGILIGFAWIAALTFGIVWVLVAATTRYSSLSGLIASLAALTFVWWQGDRDLTLLCLVITIALFITHRANLGRLLQGTESKIGARS